MPLAQFANPATRGYAKRLRRTMTPAEREFWRVARRRALGAKWRRQVVILGWIADFYCHKLRLVVELDGSSHIGREQQDALRDRAMNRHGIAVLRIPNAAAYSPGLYRLLADLAQGLRGSS